MADPVLTYPTVPGAGEVYVKDVDDVKRILPAEWKEKDDAPVRDAFLAALTAIMQELQVKGGYAAAQSDILRATDRYLSGLAEDRGFTKAPGEATEAFRARILQIPDLVTFDAIVAAVNAILAPFTPILCRAFDSVQDRWFVTDGTAAFHSYVGKNVAPYYPDRLYQDHAVAVNGGVFIPQSQPTGAWCFGDTVGRYFVIVVPDISPRDSSLQFCYDGTGPHTDAAYIADGSNTASQESSGTDATFVFTQLQTALAVYQSIVNTVERISGQGIRWQLYADPSLT